jgi:hypothetical protein
MKQHVWTKLIGKVVVLNFALSLITVTEVAAQEKVKFPVSASSKILGYGRAGTVKAALAESEQVRRSQLPRGSA